MRKPLSILLACLVMADVSNAQNIGGIVNAYASVTAVNGAVVSVSTGSLFAPGDKVMLIQMKGAGVTTTNNNTFGNITSMGGAGTYEFRDVGSVSNNSVTLTSNPVYTYNVQGYAQLIKVPKFCQAVVGSSITCPAWSHTTGTGGVIAFEAGTLILAADISADAKGFKGGNFASSGFCCSNGGFAGPFNAQGGQKGESISHWIAQLDGMKGKQANGGGGGNCGNSGGGGGGNAGVGGIGGNQYSGCGLFDDRGIGGLNLPPSLTTLFMGGGGGGGFRDNGQACSPGGTGGGIIYIKANVIFCNNRIISARGENVTLIINDESAGGGGAGGSIFIECSNYSGNLTVNTSGGFGGSNFNTIFSNQCHGPGGGGGGGVFAFTQPILPGNITHVTTGGAPGMVNNPASSCYNTSSGAAAGSNGTVMPNLPTIPLAFAVPSLNVSQTNFVCTGQTASLLAFGATNYTWNTGATASAISVSPLATTVYTVIGASGACTATAVHTLVVAPGPSLTINGNSPICSGETSTITITGADTFSWSTGSTDTFIVVTPPISTVYAVTGSITGCSTLLNYSLQVIPTPTVAIAGGGLICSGQSATLTAATASSYVWSTGSTSSVIVVAPATNTVFSVTGANASCTTAANVFLTVNPTPTLSTSGPGTICSGQPAQLGVSGASFFSWSTGSGQSVITVTPQTTTVYTVTGASSGCSAVSTLTVNVIPTPTITVLGNSLICSGQSAVLSAATASNYSWSNGVATSGNTVSPASTTTYSVTGANATCTNSAVFTVNVNPTPTVSIMSPNLSICSGKSTALTAQGADSFQWNNGSGQYHINVSPHVTTTYSVTGTTKNCSSSAGVVVLVTPTPTLVTGQYSLCAGKSSATMHVSGAESYSWIPSTGLSNSNSSITVASPPTSLTYTLIGTNAFCTASVMVPVTVYSVPVISVSSSTDFICSGTSVTLTASGAYTYEWKPDAGISNSTGSIAVTDPWITTTYTAYGSTGNGCTGAAAKTISVALSPITFMGSGTRTLCLGDGLELMAFGADNYYWVPANSLSSPTGSLVVASPIAAQIYTVTGVNGEPPLICSSSATFALEVVPGLSVGLAGPDSVCYGSTAYLYAFGAKDYTWEPAFYLNSSRVSDPICLPLTDVVYTVTGAQSGMCAGVNTLAIIVKPLPEIEAGSDTIIGLGEMIYLRAVGDASIYTWSSHNGSYINCINCPRTLAKPETKTYYTIEVSDSAGCRNSDIIMVDVIREDALYVPNSFTPNGDGINDEFRPLGFGIIEYTMQIFNRWGQKLFEGEGNMMDGKYIHWDGRFKGVICKPEGYVYVIHYTIPGQKTRIKQGEVILLTGAVPSE